MDPWKLYDITHRDDVYCNPLSTVKFEELVEALVGEPYWRRTPDPSYLAADRMRADDFSTHQDIYLRWGRDTMGWALYLFRR